MSVAVISVPTGNVISFKGILVLEIQADGIAVICIRFFPRQDVFARKGQARRCIECELTGLNIHVGAGVVGCVSVGIPVY